MALTSGGLTDAGLGPGKTTNFLVQYENSLPGQGTVRANANALLAVLENEFAVTTRWFATPAGRFGPHNRQVVNLNIAGGGGGNNSGHGNAINIDSLGSGPSPVESVKMVFMNEWVEILMSLSGGRWNALDSSGEGLSQLCGILRFPVGHYSYYGSFVGGWLNTAPRPDWVDRTEQTDRDGTSFGCALAFLFYLQTQLGHDINSILAAGAANLATVYRTLTGQANGWASFIALLNQHYPPNDPTGAAFSYNPSGDDLFPVSNLSAFFSPNQITSGYSDSSPIFVDNTAKAELLVALASDDPIVSVPPFVTIPPGATSVAVPLTTTAIAGPFPLRAVTVRATYAGQSRTATVDVAPPRVASVTLSPNAVTAGDSCTGTVTLNRPSLLGDVVVRLFSGSPGFATVPTQVTIRAHAASADFTVTVPPQLIPFSSARAAIVAEYGASSAMATLTVHPSVIAGILQRLTLIPASVTGGHTSRGIVTLQAAVPTDTLVGLAAVDSGAHPPLPNQGSSVASVPPSITIHAGNVSGSFNIATTHVASQQIKHVTIMAGAVAIKYAALTVTG